METKNYMITKERFFEIKDKFKETLLSKENRKQPEESLCYIAPNRIRLEHFIVYNILRDKPLSTGIKDIKSQNIVRAFEWVKCQILGSVKSAYSKRHADYFFAPFGLTDEEVEMIREKIRDMKI